MVAVRYSIYFLKHRPRFWGVVEVEVDPSNFNWRRLGRGVVEVRYSIYFLQPLPRFGGVGEVEVCPLILVGEGVVEVGERCGAGEI